MMSEATTLFERILTAREKTELAGQLVHDREIVGVDLSGADLRGAQFVRVVLDHCNLAGADLRGAHFIHCDLLFVVLSGVQTGDNRFVATTLVEAIGLPPDDRAAFERSGAVFRSEHASLR
jgi:uncharacterized protein YjbI with pentapeptide repeats